MTEEQRNALLKAQQGELDGVETYLSLAQTVTNETDRETFKALAADEGRHASVFRQYTDVVLKPKKLQATAVVILYRLLGKRVLYPIIAQFEYSAISGYEQLEEEFPEVGSVKNDEKRHGDTLKELLNNGEFNDKPLLPVIAGVSILTFLVSRLFRADSE
ncbi:MAG: rubrerythrin [Lachnospiraceae bacterium]|nr:rubrerythrin [Lachnospiraceae bacterium]